MVINIKNCITEKYSVVNMTYDMNEEWETNTLRFGSLNFVWPKFDNYSMFIDFLCFEMKAKFTCCVLF